MNQTLNKSWLFQCRADKWGLNDYLSAKFESSDPVYLTVKKFEREIIVGDNAYVWRAGLNQGVVAKGKVIAEATQLKDIPEIALPSPKLDPYKEGGNTLKVGIQLDEVHLNESENFYSKADFSSHPILRHHDIITKRRGSVFSLDTESSECLNQILLKRWGTKSYPESPSAIKKDFSSTDFNNFEFNPKPPPQELNPTERKAPGSSTASHQHRVIQNKLYDYLCKFMGKENVACEHTIGERKADIIVQKGDSFDIYEIKTSSCPRECIKEALGQLLDYAYYEPKFKDSCCTLWVVGKNEADEKTWEYIDHLKEKHCLPLDYYSQSID